MQPTHQEALQEEQFVESPEWDFEVVSAITPELIEKIHARTLCGIRIKNFCSPRTAAQIAAGLFKDESRTPYQVKWVTQSDQKKSSTDFLETTTAKDSDVDRVGPVSSTIFNYDSSESYKADAVRHIRLIRSYCSPALSPVDRLRLELDEVLPGGAQIMNYADHGKAFVGVGRIMSSSKEMLHADTARAGCLTCNIYLQVPRTGGGTRVWNYSGEYEKAPGSYLFAPGEIPSSVPSALLQPTAGEMVIWNPLNPHVVLPFTGEPRISIQIWLQVTGSTKDRSLKIQFLN